MLNRDANTAKFNSALIRINEELKNLGKLNLMSQGVQAEYLFRRLLNSLYGWDLSNANEHSSNAEAVDLVDDGRRLAVQVSVTCTTDKVNKTLNKKKTKEYTEKGYRLGFFAPKSSLYAVLRTGNTSSCSTAWTKSPMHAWGA